MFASGSGVRELTARARRAAELALLLIENRLELVSLELREEMHNFVRVVIRALFTVFLSLFALILACVTIVWLSPPDSRGWVVLGITIVFTLLAFVSLNMLHRASSRMGKPLHRTIEEFRRDRERL